MEDAADGESRAGRLSVIGWGLGRRGLLRKSIVDVEREAEWESLGGKERAFIWLFYLLGLAGWFCASEVHRGVLCILCLDWLMGCFG